MKYELHNYGKTLWYYIDENGKNYMAYQCKKCNDLTPHQYVEHNDNNVIYECVYCNTRKSVYRGFRKTPQRTNMTTLR